MSASLVGRVALAFTQPKKGQSGARPLADEIADLRDDAATLTGYDEAPGSVAKPSLEYAAVEWHANWVQQ
jgi:hypothetical protein